MLALGLLFVTGAARAELHLVAPSGMPVGKTVTAAQLWEEVRPRPAAGRVVCRRSRMKPTR
ncbi:MAG: hypothetical protein WDM96_00105 [Lacunisphaera sp.]